MDFIYYYLFFALVTAVTSCYELVAPVLASEKLQNSKVDYELLFYFTSFFMFLLIAPIAFIACIVPTIGESFRTGLQKGYFDKQ